MGNDGERGSLLVTAIFLVAVSSTLVASMLRMEHSGIASSAANLHSARALYIAESGQQWARYAMKSRVCDCPADTVYPSGCNFTPSQTPSPPYFDDPTTVTSGSTGYFKVTVEDVVGSSPARLKITVVGQAIAETSGNLGQAPVLARRQVVREVEVSKCFGMPEESGPVMPTFETSDGSDGSFDTSSNSNTTLGAGDYGTVDIGSNGSLTFNTTDGTYHIDELILSSNTTLTLAPGDYFIGSLDISSNMDLNISPAGEVNLYVDGSIDISSNVELNVGGSVGNLTLWSYSSTQIDISSNASFTGTIISNGDVAIASNATILGVVHTLEPTADINVGSNAAITGALLSAGNITLSSNVTVNGASVYDGTYSKGSNVNPYGVEISETNVNQNPTIVETTLPTFSTNTCTGTTSACVKSINSNSTGSYAAGNYKSITAKSNANVTFTTNGGNYYITSLSMTGATNTGTSTLTLAPGNYYINMLSIGPNTNVVISPSGVVNLYVQQTVAIGGDDNDTDSVDDGARINYGGTASNFNLYWYNEGGDLDLSVNSSITGTIWGAPLVEGEDGTSNWGETGDAVTPITW